MSCCGGKKENFQDYLEYGPYPGGEFQSDCGGGYGYGGSGAYGTYGGCDNEQEPFHYEQIPNLIDFDQHTNLHDSNCNCPTCQTPYSFPYAAKPSECGNPHCKGGPCKCGGKSLMATMQEQTLLDVGVDGGNAHLMLPGVNIQLDLFTILKYLLVIFVVCYIAFRLMGRRR